MINLIKNELIKIFKKKTIYITLILVLAFIIFTNVMYKYSGAQGNYYFEYSQEYINSLKDELAKLNQNEISDNTIYIDIKSELDIAEISSQFEADAWQRQIINQKL